MIRLSTRRSTWKITGSTLAVFIAMLVFLFSCVGKSKGPATGAENIPEGAGTISGKPCFIQPDVPYMITDIDERTKYLALHWWDRFDFADTACIHNPDVTEQVFVDFLDILPFMNDAGAAEAIRNLLSRAEKEETRLVYGYFLELAEKYLYDPNSPLRDEELYVPFIEYVLSSNDSDGISRMRPALQLEEINKNRWDAMATDFTYMLPDGRTGSLHGIRAEYILLYFHNPDCGDCQRTKEMLERSELISSLTEAGKMNILALYPNGNPEEWEACCRMSMPDGWINARDGSKKLVIKEQLYFLRAIPSLYLLDRDKRVILKDADYPRLEAWLGQLLLPI